MPQARAMPPAKPMPAVIPPQMRAQHVVSIDDVRRSERSGAAAAANHDLDVRIAEAADRELATQWVQRHCEDMPPQLCYRLGRMLAGMPQAPGQIFDQVQATPVGWRLNFRPNYRRKGKEVVGDREAWRVMGMHGTDPQGIRGILRDGYMRGSEDLPHVYFASSLGSAPGHLASGIEVFHRVAAGKKIIAASW